MHSRACWLGPWHQCTCGFPEPSKWNPPFVFVYLDDIIIFSQNLEEHVQHIRLVLHRLLENRLYVKAEKCKFHVTSLDFLGFIIKCGQVRADSAKVRAVTYCPLPENRKHLQRFLGFANFYRRFIRDYSRVVAPLTRLTSIKLPYRWSPEAEVAFCHLMFSSSPVLSHPDTSLQFVMEVDASDTRVGCVVTAFPCWPEAAPLRLFLSPSFPGQEELRHWQSGAASGRPLPAGLDTLVGGSRAPVFWSGPTTGTWSIYAQPNNLTPARPSGLYSWDVSTSRSLTAGAPGTLSPTPSPTSSPSTRRGLQRNSFSPPDASWQQPGGMWSAQCSRLSALILPPLTIPRAVCSFWTPPGRKCSSRGNSSKLACHPVFQRTLSFVRCRFWWPLIYSDTKEFVSACSVCARGKASHRAPAGLLWSLPVPHRPWSHMAVDFVTGLPPSEGKTVILTILDRFSKAVHFVPLSKLPSALETAKLLVLHVFKIHRIPVDIVYNRGPQFILQVWKAFCRAIWASVRHNNLTGAWWRCDQWVVWPVLSEWWRTRFSLSSLCWGRRWAGRHRGFVRWTMVILNVKERRTRQDMNHGWDEVGALWTHSLPRRLLGHWNRGLGYGGDGVLASDEWWSWSHPKEHCLTGIVIQSPWWGKKRLMLLLQKFGCARVDVTWSRFWQNTRVKKMRRLGGYLWGYRKSALLRCGPTPETSLY